MSYLRHLKGNAKKATECLSQDYTGGVKTEDLNIAFPLYPVASHTNTSSQSGMGPSLPLTFNALTALAQLYCSIRENVCKSVTHGMISVTRTCIHSLNT